jgi:hypothetical protein
VDLFLILAAAEASVETTPQLSSVSVTSVQPGMCSNQVTFPSAAISVSWTSDGFDPDVHVYKLYENGVLKATQTSTTWQKTIVGSVENGPYQEWVSDWTYRVDIANASTGQVYSSLESEPWRQYYGSCRNTPEPE